MLKKALITTVFIFLVSTIALGFQQGATWEKFNSPEGEFNILAPAKPELEVRDLDTAQKDAQSPDIAKVLTSFDLNK